MKKKCHFLYWETKKKERYFAGVAFRNEDFGEYYLKIDCHPYRRIYLKDSETKGKQIKFKVEEYKRISSSHNVRNTIGYGETNRKNPDEIEIFMIPHLDLKLVLTFGENP